MDLSGEAKYRKREGLNRPCGSQINQSARIEGENYIVVNYDSFRICRASGFYGPLATGSSPRAKVLNLRTLIRQYGEANVEVIHQTERLFSSRGGRGSAAPNRESTSTADCG